jgi:hypothetical protein
MRQHLGNSGLVLMIVVALGRPALAGWKDTRFAEPEAAVNQSMTDQTSEDAARNTLFAAALADVLQLRADADGRIRELLSPDQQAAWDAARQELAQNFDGARLNLADLQSLDLTDAQCETIVSVEQSNHMMQRALVHVAFRQALTSLSEAAGAALDTGAAQLPPADASPAAKIGESSQISPAQGEGAPPQVSAAELAAAESVLIQLRSDVRAIRTAAHDQVLAALSDSQRQTLEAGASAGPIAPNSTTPALAKLDGSAALHGGGLRHIRWLAKELAADSGAAVNLNSPSATALSADQLAAIDEIRNGLETDIRARVQQAYTDALSLDAGTTVTGGTNEG